MTELTTSVVIASVGGASLYELISALGASSYEVYEIIVVLPEGVTLGPVGPVAGELREIQSVKKGQVAQRAVGLRAARGDLVIQMDDDLCFDASFLGEYVEHFIGLSPRYSALALGPRFVQRNEHLTSNSTGSAVLDLTKSAYFALLGGMPWGHRKMGSYSNLTCAASYSGRSEQRSFVISEWLAGGCVLTRRADLITDDFYPFSGKAYCEDLLHSRLRQNRGIIQAVSINLEVTIDNIKDELTLRQLYPLTIGRWRAGILLGANRFRLALFLGAEVLRLSLALTLFKMRNP